MLTSDLLRVKIIKNEHIQPLFVEINEENLFIADTLIDLYRSSVSKKVSDLEDKLKEIEYNAESLGYDFKLFRGLKSLLDRRLIIEENDESDAIKIRAMIFELVNQHYKGIILKEEEKERIFLLVSQKIGKAPDRIKEIFNSIYEEEKKIKDFLNINAEDLLRQYNLSLLQTLLFKCRKLFVDLEVSGHEMRNILWMIKKLNLLFLAEKSYIGLNLAIDGPASVIKQTERYGTRIAKLLPHLFKARNWHIRAYIAYKIRNKKKIFKLELSRREAQNLLPHVINEEIEYDSYVEEDFSKKFYSIGGEWQIIREPEPILIGRDIFIPDFVLIKNDKKVYLEIMGFWSEDYIKRKIEKLKKLADINLILAIDSSLGNIEINNLNPNIYIIKYNRKISIADIIKVLNKF
ncbi:MAG: DUF790 family protein [Thermoproteota archaeon]|jgi:predicted nuclease of restriction endonuclease-like RecB superfamily|nr:DUF790 family protein [Thermoproteota archaeon]